MFPKFAEQSYAQYDFRMRKGSNSGLYIKAKEKAKNMYLVHVVVFFSVY